ncbi:MAG: Hpt domain-containing protein [Bacteroidetes bacterium]|nr:Hpt domain-containing protein [Bacteroidota bacterium]
MTYQETGSEKYNSIPVVDIETIEMLKHHAGGNLEILSDLFDSFFPEAEEQINELFEAVDNNDKEKFLKSAHGLSGITATIGATQLKTLAVDMEKLAKAGNFDEAYKLLDNINVLYEQFVEKAKELINS